MSSGFFNALRESMKDPSFKEKICTYIVVHDSSCSSIPVEKLFELRPFLDKNYTEYCLGLANHICLLFDLLQGDDYDKAIPVFQKASNVLEYKGSATALLPIYDKIMGCKSYSVRSSLSRDQLVPQMVKSPMARFIDQKGTCISLDKSEYTIQFEKIG